MPMRTQRMYFSGPAALAVMTGLCLLFVCLCSGSPARAAHSSWLIQEDAFVRSAHAELDCVQCHESIGADDHPSAEALFQEKSTAFSLESCLGCHPDVEEELAAGTHAGKPVPPDADMKDCVSCHDPHTVGFAAGQPETERPAAELSEESRQCLSCHAGKNVTDTATPKLCLTCHEQGTAVTHTSLSCLSCHTTAASFPHTDMPDVNCLSCHVRHTESSIHDAHTRLSCTSCHSAGVQPVAKAGQVNAVTVSQESVHTLHLPAGTASCVRCHDASARPGGAVLAAESILPPKGVLCAGCHAATLTVPDTPSQIGLGVFVLGFAGLAILWLSAGRGACAAAGPAAPAAQGAHTESACRRIATLCADIFLQARLWRENRLRWFIHALIFFPFVIRAGWGLAASLGAWLAPASSWPWHLLAKDWPATALVNDICGLLLLAGLVLAMWQQAVRQRTLPANAPKAEWSVLILLTVLTLTGFVLEGARIALDMLALQAADTGWAFAGMLFAKFFLPLGAERLAGMYGSLWTVHAAVTALTVACIPFTRLRHIVTTPLFLLVQALRGHRG